MSMRKRLLVLASPSGGGKSTVAKYMMKKLENLEFSISATTRDKRPGEEHAKDYFFISKDEFKNRIDSGDLIEYEEIFTNYYGTLKSEVDKAINSGKDLLFDIDVKGAYSVRKFYPELSLLVFIAPPSLEVLEERLRARSTETEEQIQTRLSRAEMEMAESKNFDYLVINDKLEDTYKQIDEIIEKHLI